MPFESVKVPLSEPVFSMSTSPVWAASPGRRLLAERTATPCLELPIVSVPEAKVFAGFAEVALKSAPDPTTAVAASRSVRSAPSASLGWLVRT